MTSQEITKPQSVLAFDGQDDTVELGKKPQFKVEKNLTLEAWICVASQKGYAGIISNIYDTGSTESGYGLLLDGESGIYFGLKIPSARIQYLSSGANTIILNQWHHIAATYDGQEMKLYVDGIEKAKQEWVGTNINYNPENDLFLGMYKDNDEIYAFTGKMAEIRLWNITRTQQEIQNNLFQRLVGNESGLIGYWLLNEGSGNTVSDKTANRNQGNIRGATWVQSLLPVAFRKTPELLVAETVAAQKVVAEAKAIAQKALEEKAAADKVAAEAQATAQKALEEKAAADKVAAEAKAATDKALALKAAAETEVAEAQADAQQATAQAKATTEEALAEKALAETTTAQAKAATEKDLTDKATALAKAAQEAQAAAQAKAAADKAITEKEAAEKEAADAKAAAEKAVAEAKAAVERATASKAVAEAQAAQEAEAAQEAQAATEKAVAQREAAEKETAQAQAAASKAEAEAQAAKAATVIAQAQAAARKAAAEAEIAQIKAAAAKKMEKVEAEAEAAEARAKAAAASAKAKEVEQKATGVKPLADAPVSESDVREAKERLLNSTGLEDYGYWWEQMLKQPQAEGDRTVRRGRIWN